MHRLPTVLQGAGAVVFAAALAAWLALASPEDRISLAFFISVSLTLSGLLLGSQWSRDNIPWLYTPRKNLLRLYQDLYRLKGEIEPYKQDLSGFDHGEWIQRIESIEDRFGQTMKNEVDYLWDHKRRGLHHRIDRVRGLAVSAAPDAIHRMVNERLDLLAEVMREPGLD